MFYKIICCFILLAAAWLAGLSWFVSQIPTSPPADDIKTDVIVVLTGGAGRLEYGLELLAAGKGKQLFVSGVSEGVPLSDILSKATPDARNIITHLPYNAVILGTKAVNTIGNAEETAHWVEKHHFKSVRLVTSSYHMPRSVGELHEAMPGVTIVPDAVFTTRIAGSWWQNPDTRGLVLSEYHKFIASQLRHLLISSKH